MTLSEAKLCGFYRLRDMSPGTLQYSGSNNTIYSATVYKSVYRDSNRNMDITGFTNELDNVYVMAKTTEIASWNLEPLTTEVTLDGTKFMTGKTVTVDGPVTTVWLRNYRN